MPGKSPAGPLMREHRVIERMIAVLRTELASMAAVRRTDPVLIGTATDFIRTYADRCHHGKEEDILFARLAEKTLDAELAQTMQDLITDHVHGRVLTRRLDEANGLYASGDETALPAIESAIQALVDFYPVHIQKEDRHFFKPCMQYFSDDEQAQMLRDFDEFDRALIHERYLRVVEGFEARSGRPAPTR